MPVLIKHDGASIGIAESDNQGLNVLKWFHDNCHAYSMAHALEHEGYSTEEVDSVDCHDVESLISAICARRRVTMESVFVPFSQSQNVRGADGKPWRSLNWRVTLKDSRGRVILTTDYGQGEAHAPAYKWQGTPHGKREAITLEIETGKIAKAIFGWKPSASAKPIPGPSIGDVMQSLARDADALDADSFEEWAAELGYDTDSRKAESIYQACIGIGLALRRGLGESVLAEIRLAASFN